MENSQEFDASSVCKNTNDRQLDGSREGVCSAGKISASPEDRSVRTKVVKRKRRWRPSLKQLKEKNQRDADSSRILNLTLDVNDLRKQVHDCIVQKSIRETRILVAREQFHARSLQSVDNFFQLFRHGHPGVLTPTQQTYLTTLLDENIDVGGGVNGREEFFEQWRRYKHLFRVRRLTNFTAKVVTSDNRGCLIECSGEFDGRVTAAALETVFPHVLEDKSLVNQVLHHRFVCPTKTLINFDAYGRLVQYEAHADVFDAMSVLLDSDPFRIEQLMADAMISDGSLLPPGKDDDAEGENAAMDCDDRQESSVGDGSPESIIGSSRTSIDFLLS